MLKFENILSGNQKNELQKKTIPEPIRLFVESKRKLAQEERDKCLKFAKNSYQKMKCYEVYEICAKNISRSIPLLAAFYNERKGRL